MLRKMMIIVGSLTTLVTSHLIAAAYCCGMNPESMLFDGMLKNALCCRPLYIGTLSILMIGLVLIKKNISYSNFFKLLFFVNVLTYLGTELYLNQMTINPRGEIAIFIGLLAHLPLGFYLFLALLSLAYYSYKKITLYSTLVEQIIFIKNLPFSREVNFLSYLSKTYSGLSPPRFI